MKISKFLLLNVAGVGVLLTSYTFATSTKTQVVISEQSIITGIQSVDRVVLSGSDIQNAIANNTPLKTVPIAHACVFTSHPEGDYDFTISAERKYRRGINFALYNSSLVK